MKSRRTIPVAILLGALMESCGPSSSTTEATKPAVVEPDRKESLYRRGHKFFVERDYDNARIILEQALVLDSTYLAPLVDLAQIHYDLAMRQEGERNPLRLDEFRRAMDAYARMESAGRTDADIYERLCEIAYALGEKELFLYYARKNADKYPYDRQYNNLGLAYAQVGDHADVIKTQKEAIDRFPLSPFIGSFYRQLGNGYMDLDRHQTAEKTFAAGVKVVTARLLDLKQGNSDLRNTGEYGRLTEDRMSMLISLKKLYLIYREDEKLKEVERQLKDSGYTQ